MHRNTNEYGYMEKKNRTLSKINEKKEKKNKEIEHTFSWNLLINTYRLCIQ